MKENIREILTRAIFEVFEKMFFVFLEPVETARARYDSVSFIDFTGRISGAFCLKMSRGFSELMTQNMLSCETLEITEQMIEDCSKEAANMIAGNFLRKLDERDVFNLNLPKYARMDQAADYGLILSGEDDVVVSFESENEPLQVRLAWQEATEERVSV